MPEKKNSIPVRVSAQLLAMGIPAAKHTAVGLASRFPGEFNIGAAGLDAEELAKVLIHFTKQGILAPPHTGAGTSIKKVRPGWHFCRFYRDFDQLLAIVTPYMAEGLKNGEGCLWVLPKPVTSDSACDALVREEISGALLRKQDEALAKGFKFLRAAGDAGSVSGTEQSRGFIEYEMNVNAALAATKVAAVCTFRADVTADELVAIVTAHQDALYSAPAAWPICAFLSRSAFSMNATASSPSRATWRTVAPG